MFFFFFQVTGSSCISSVWKWLFDRGVVMCGCGTPGWVLGLDTLFIRQKGQKIDISEYVLVLLKDFLFTEIALQRRSGTQTQTQISTGVKPQTQTGTHTQTLTNTNTYTNTNTSKNRTRNQKKQNNFFVLIIFILSVFCMQDFSEIWIQRRFKLQKTLHRSYMGGFFLQHRYAFLL